MGLMRMGHGVLLGLIFSSVVACGEEPGRRVLVDGTPVVMQDEEIRERIRSGGLAETSLLWTSGSWQRLDAVPELARMLAEERSRAARTAPPTVDAGPSAPRVVRVRMEYVAEGFPLGLSTLNGRGASLADAPDAAYRVLPPRQADRLFGAFYFGEQMYLAVLEAAAGGKPARLYLDLDGDGDLTDDPGPFSPEGDAAIPAFYTIRLPSSSPGMPGAAYRLWWFPSNMGGTAFYAACHQAGRFPYGELPMVLFDANADGDYANDPLLIDWNQDGRAAPTEAYLKGEPIPVGEGQIRCLEIAKDGSEVTFGL